MNSRKFAMKDLLLPRSIDQRHLNQAEVKKFHDTLNVILCFFPHHLARFSKSLFSTTNANAKRQLLSAVSQLTAQAQKQNSEVDQIKEVLQNMVVEAYGMEQHNSQLLRQLNTPGIRFLVNNLKKPTPIIPDAFFEKEFELHNLLISYPNLPESLALPDFNEIQSIMIERELHHAKVIQLAIECLGDSHVTLQFLTKLPTVVNTAKKYV